MDLEILEESESLTRVALKGRLDTAGVDRIETRLNAVLGGRKHALLDLSDVTFLSSLGIRMLISVAKMLDRRGQKLVLVAPRPLIDQALRHSSLDEIIPVAADVDGARMLLNS
ncbi:MAG TPA: STAS domain-containing protein [Planctomycetota bacterium]|jgi:anti-anti-sigma factor|nr:STAS domain-containing protein [Planctomycetota bacterium]